MSWWGQGVLLPLKSLNFPKSDQRVTVECGGQVVGATLIEEEVSGQKKVHLSLGCQFRYGKCWWM